MAADYYLKILDGTRGYTNLPKVYLYVLHGEFFVASKKKGSTKLPSWMEFIYEDY